MTELKTLKDIQLWHHIENCPDEYTCNEVLREYYIKTDLRLEAIKDIKAIRAGREGTDPAIFDVVPTFNKGVEDYIKWKFNLSEEDLK